MKKIVTLGGGSGQFTLLSALKSIPDVSITAIVSMSDSGGSTGVLRDEYGVLPPGDVLKCLIALSPYREARDILQARFSVHEKLANHNAGNFLLTFLSERTGGDFSVAIAALAEILKVSGHVVPVTLDKHTLCVALETGEKVYGEALIDVPRGERKAKIVDAFLVPHNGSLNANPDALVALVEADVVIVSPGDLYTSIIPNLLFEAVGEAIKKNTNAPLWYIANIMTKHGETDGFSMEDFVRVMGKYLPRPFDLVMVNSGVPSSSALAAYAKERAEPVRATQTGAVPTYEVDLLLESNGLVRHDAEKLSRMLATLIGRIDTER